MFFLRKQFGFESSEFAIDACGSAKAKTLLRSFPEFSRICRRTPSAAGILAALRLGGFEIARHLSPGKHLKASLGNGFFGSASMFVLLNGKATEADLSNRYFFHCRQIAKRTGFRRNSRIFAGLTDLKRLRCGNERGRNTSQPLVLARVCGPTFPYIGSKALGRTSSIWR